MSSYVQNVNTVRERRLALGLSQAQLAEQAGISRTAISAIEGHRLAPAVTTALALARCLDCTVEELFGGVPCPSQVAWAWTPPQSTWRYYQAEVQGRRWLYPIEQTEASPLPHDGLCTNLEVLPFDDRQARQTLVLATCDPASNLLATEYFRRTGLRMLVIHRSSRAAMELLKQGVVHVAGLHFSSSENAEANHRFVRQNLGEKYHLVRGANWNAGLVVGSGVAAKSVGGVVKANPAWIAREPGAAARKSLDELVGSTKKLERWAPSHRAVAEGIRAGWGEAGYCPQLVAEESRLRFLPVHSEACDLCYAESFAHDFRMEKLLSVLRSEEYRRQLGELPGYDVSETGRVTL